jgi:hypothetical protein
MDKVGVVAPYEQRRTMAMEYTSKKAWPLLREYWLDKHAWIGGGKRKTRGRIVC